MDQTNGPAPGARNLKIEQALHGYRNGHRLLSCSTKLDAFSQALMLNLSDLQSSEVLRTQESYLCGYPLPSMNRYVLCRTWPAREMPRPGSVWSHSLILDFGLLAVVDDLSALLQFHRRPIASEDPSYAESIPAGDLQSVALEFGDHSRVQHLLYELYGARRLTSEIQMECSHVQEDEALCIGAWRQMWPSLRRELAFVTRSSSDLGAAQATLRIVLSTAPQQSARPDSALDVDGLTDDMALSSLLEDFPEPGPTRLRRFLGRHAFDIREPRRHVLRLVQVFARTEAEGPIAAIRDLSDWAGLGPGVDRLKRDLLAASLARSLDTTELVVLLHEFGGEPRQIATESFSSSLAAAASDPQLIATALDVGASTDRNTLGAVGFEVVAARAPAAKLVEANPSAEQRVQLVSHRPELARFAAFWPRDLSGTSAMLEALFKRGVGPQDAITGLAPILDDYKVREILRHWPTSSADILIALRDNAVPPHYATLAPAASLDAIEMCAARNETFEDSFLNHVARSLIERDEAMGLKCEAWLGLRRQANRTLNGEEYLATGICLAALNVEHDRIAIQGYQAAFDELYLAASRYRLPKQASNYLDRHLPRVPGSSVAAKLINAVIRQFQRKQHELSYLVLVSSSHLDDVLRSLWAQEGRKRVTELADRCARSSDNDVRSRAGQVRKFIERRKPFWWDFEDS